MSELGNLGTAGSGFDLPATGATVADVAAWPAFYPGDYAYNYRGEIDPAIGVDPLAYERLSAVYPYLYVGGNISTGITVVNSGTEGTGANITMESSTPAQNMYASFSFPGISTNYLSVPDAANLDLTTTMEITMRVAIAEPDNRLGNQRLIAKSGSSRGYEIYIGYDTQHATLNFTPNGSNVNTATEKLPFLPEHIYWIRVTHLSGSGSKFYWAADTGNNTEPGAWNQIGTGYISTTTAAASANTDTLKIGTYNGSGDMFKGHVYKVLVRDAETAGTTVLNIDVPADTGAMVPNVTTTFTCTTGQTVTLTTSGTYPNKLYYDVGGWSLANGNRFGTHSTMAELLTVAESVQVVWVKATVGSYSTTRRMIYPLIRAYKDSTGASYGNHSWGLYFDTFHGEIKLTAQVTAGNAFDEVFSASTGTAVGTGVQVFGVILIEHDGTTYGYNVRYNPTTEALVYQGGSAPSTNVIFATGLLDTTSVNLELWGGMTGFSISNAGVVNFPGLITSSDSIGWDTTGDVRIKPIIEDTLRVVAAGLDPEYTVGDFWRSSADGEMAIASEAVDEGDMFAVASVTPTFQQIKVNHPAQRNALYRPRYTTFGYPSSPISVSASEDFFIWMVASGDHDFDYGAYGYDGTGDAYLDMEFGRDPGIGYSNSYVFMEIDDDDGNFGYMTYRGATTSDVPLHTVWDRGFSEPTLFAQAVSRGDGSWHGWFYDATYGLTTLVNQSTDLMTGSINMDSVAFFGPDLGEGYQPTLFYGGGWQQGIGVIPDEAGLIELWERTVYGYAA